MKKPPTAPQDTAAEPERTSALLTADGTLPKRDKPRQARLVDPATPGMMTREAPGQRPAASPEERRQPQTGGRGTRALAIAPDSYDAEAHTVDAVLSTGAAVARYYFVEELEISEAAIDLSRVAGGVCPVLDTHNQYELAAQIGRVVAVRVEGDRLVGTLQFDQTQEGQDIEARVARGELRAISIGYQVTTWQITSSPGSTDTETWRAMNWQLLEASFVPVPADPNAVVRSAPGSSHGATHEEDDMNRNAPGGGVAHPNANRGAAPAAAETTIVVDQGGGTHNEITPPAAMAPAAAGSDLRAVTIAASRILDMCGRSAALGSEFASDLIRVNEATPLSETDLLSRVNERLLAGNRPNIDARAGQTGTETEGYRQAVEDSVMLRANPNAPLEDVPGRTRDQRLADARQFRNMTLMELARDYVARTGISTGSMGRLELAGAALNPSFRYGALGTSDFANALASVANKRVRAAFQAAPQTFRPMVSTGTLPDFKPTNIVGLGDAPALLLVPENGEFKRGAVTDTGLTYRLQTYGRIIPITRQAIVNDDQNLFGRIPTMFGRKAADLESDLVWGLLLSNVVMGDGYTLFDAAHHGNVSASGDPITIASVAAGRQALAKQKSPDGGVLSIKASFLVVGPSKATEAEQFLYPTAPNQASQANPFTGKLQLIEEARIADNRWFLASSPDDFDTIELDHLLGQEELFTDTRVGFDVDGVESKARLDVGAAALDYRGFYMNPGN